MNKEFSDIELNDFDPYRPNPKRIQNISESLKHDEEWRKLAETLNKYHYSLEELRSYKLVQNNDGKPRYGLTDEMWQKEFLIRKALTKPASHFVTTSQFRKMIRSTELNAKTVRYDGDTQYHYYVLFIGDVLEHIRKGQIDYCYYIYQIVELLKVEHERLVTRFVEGGDYWEVWLR